ncbi:hypothetical protein BDZ89DRAFT_1045755 [Hymenopellis radicata]|nr:hypothetical protein BDZ89DRAFT_1045755 [Hymenopellis radicata]
MFGLIDEVFVAPRENIIDIGQSGPTSRTVGFATCEGLEKIIKFDERYNMIDKGVNLWAMLSGKEFLKDDSETSVEGGNGSRFTRYIWSLLSTALSWQWPEHLACWPARTRRGKRTYPISIVIMIATNEANKAIVFDVSGGLTTAQGMGSFHDSDPSWSSRDIRWGGSLLRWNQSENVVELGVGGIKNFAPVTIAALGQRGSVGINEHRHLFFDKVQGIVDPGPLHESWRIADRQLSDWRPKIGYLRGDRLDTSDRAVQLAARRAERRAKGINALRASMIYIPGPPLRLATRTNRKLAGEQTEQRQVPADMPGVERETDTPNIPWWLKHAGQSPRELLRSRVFVYPWNASASGIAGGEVTVTGADLERLAPQKLLSDSVVMFGLRLALKELEDRDVVAFQSIYVYSNFFYNVLKERGYGAVTKWTKGIDIFRKDTLLVPVNETGHWFLVVICDAGWLLKDEENANDRERGGDMTCQERRHTALCERLANYLAEEAETKWGKTTGRRALIYDSTAIETY